MDPIFAEEDVPNSQTRFIEINKIYFKDKDIARTKLGDVKPAPAG